MQPPQTITTADLATGGEAVALGGTATVNVSAISAGAVTQGPAANAPTLVFPTAGVYRLYATLTVRSGSNARTAPTVQVTGAGVTQLASSNPYLRSASSGLTITRFADFRVTANTEGTLTLSNPRIGTEQGSNTTATITGVSGVVLMAIGGVAGPAGAQGPAGPQGPPGQGIDFEPTAAGLYNPVNAILVGGENVNIVGDPEADTLTLNSPLPARIEASHTFDPLFEDASTTEHLTGNVTVSGNLTQQQARTKLGTIIEQTFDLSLGTTIEVDFSATAGFSGAAPIVDVNGRQIPLDEFTTFTFTITQPRFEIAVYASTQGISAAITLVAISVKQKRPDAPAQVWVDNAIDAVKTELEGTITTTKDGLESTITTNKTDADTAITNLRTHVDGRDTLLQAEIDELQNQDPEPPAVTAFHTALSREHRKDADTSWSSTTLDLKHSGEWRGTRNVIPPEVTAVSMYSPSASWVIVSGLSPTPPMLMGGYFNYHQLSQIGDVDSVLEVKELTGGWRSVVANVGGFGVVFRRRQVTPGQTRTTTRRVYVGVDTQVWQPQDFTQQTTVVQAVPDAPQQVLTWEIRCFLNGNLQGTQNVTIDLTGTRYNADLADTTVELDYGEGFTFTLRWRFDKANPSNGENNIVVGEITFEALHDNPAVLYGRLYHEESVTVATADTVNYIPGSPRITHNLGYGNIYYFISLVTLANGNIGGWSRAFLPTGTPATAASAVDLGYSASEVDVTTWRVRNTSLFSVSRLLPTATAPTVTAAAVVLTNYLWGAATPAMEGVEHDFLQVNTPLHLSSLVDAQGAAINVTGTALQAQQITVASLDAAVNLGPGQTQDLTVETVTTGILTVTDAGLLVFPKVGIYRIWAKITGRATQSNRDAHPTVNVTGSGIVRLSYGHTTLPNDTTASTVERTVDLRVFTAGATGQLRVENLNIGATPSQYQMTGTLGIYALPLSSLQGEKGERGDKGEAGTPAPVKPSQTITAAPPALAANRTIAVDGVLDLTATAVQSVAGGVVSLDGANLAFAAEGTYRIYADLTTQAVSGQRAAPSLVVEGTNIQTLGVSNPYVRESQNTARVVNRFCDFRVLASTAVGTIRVRNPQLGNTSSVRINGIANAVILPIGTLAGPKGDKGEDGVLLTEAGELNAVIDRRARALDTPISDKVTTAEGNIAANTRNISTNAADILTINDTAVGAQRTANNANTAAQSAVNQSILNQRDLTGVSTRVGAVEATVSGRTPVMRHLAVETSGDLVLTSEGQQLADTGVSLTRLSADASITSLALVVAWPQGPAPAATRSLTANAAAAKLIIRSTGLIQLEQLDGTTETYGDITAGPALMIADTTTAVLITDRGLRTISNLGGVVESDGTTSLWRVLTGSIATQFYNFLYLHAGDPQLGLYRPQGTIITSDVPIKVEGAAAGFPRLLGLATVSSDTNFQQSGWKDTGIDLSMVGNAWVLMIVVDTSATGQDTVPAYSCHGIMTGSTLKEFRRATAGTADSSSSHALYLTSLRRPSGDESVYRIALNQAGSLLLSAISNSVNNPTVRVLRVF